MHRLANLWCGQSKAEDLRKIPLPTDSDPEKLVRVDSDSPRLLLFWGAASLTQVLWIHGVTPATITAVNRIRIAM